MAIIRKSIILGVAAGINQTWWCQRSSLGELNEKLLPHHFKRFGRIFVKYWILLHDEKKHALKSIYWMIIKLYYFKNKYFDIFDCNKKVASGIYFIFRVFQPQNIWASQLLDTMIKYYFAIRNDSSLSVSLDSRPKSLCYMIRDILIIIDIFSWNYLQAEIISLQMASITFHTWQVASIRRHEYIISSNRITCRISWKATDVGQRENNHSHLEYQAMISTNHLAKPICCA